MCTLGGKGLSDAMLFDNVIGKARPKVSYLECN